MPEPMTSAAAIAEQLVNDLMLVNVLVAGEGAPAQVEALIQAGAAAEILLDDPATADPQSFDLAILRAPPDSAGEAATADRIKTLCAASERLLFVPSTGDSLRLADLTTWFEILAELGYQPVVEFDAGFVAPGAFLVDRSATAAESELAAFAERLSTGQTLAAETVENAAATAPTDPVISRAAHEAACAAMRAEADSLRASLEAARAALADAEARNAGWEGLRQWVSHAVADLGRHKKNPPRRGLRSLFRKTPPDPDQTRLDREADLLRASPLFDPAWYIASNPDLAAEGGDPVHHYIRVGAPRGADPSPWFDTKAYLEQQPEPDLSGHTPLGHAIVSGAAGS